MLFYSYLCQSVIRADVVNSSKKKKKIIIGGLSIHTKVDPFLLGFGKLRANGFTILCLLISQSFSYETFPHKFYYPTIIFITVPLISNFIIACIKL